MQFIGSISASLSVDAVTSCTWARTQHSHTGWFKKLESKRRQTFQGRRLGEGWRGGIAVTQERERHFGHANFSVCYLNYCKKLFPLHRISFQCKGRNVACLGLLIFLTAATFTEQVACTHLIVKARLTAEQCIATFNGHWLFSDVVV